MKSKHKKLTEEIDLRKLLSKNIAIKDISNAHSGVINEIRICENGIHLYAISFGQNVWLKLNDINKTWWIKESK